MEHILASAKRPPLLKSLDFSMSGESRYVLQRRSVTFYPVSASTYTSNGVRVCRITCSGSEWLDMSTVRLQFTAKNVNTVNLQPASGPHCFWERLRVLAGGTVLEDISYYQNHHELFETVLAPAEMAWAEGVEGFGSSRAPWMGAIEVVPKRPIPGFIAAGQTQTVLMRLKSGVCECGRNLPQRFIPLTFELTLGTAADALLDQNTLSYEVQGVQIKADVLQLDSSVENSFYEALLKNQSLQFAIPSYVVQSQTVSGTEFSVAIVRALTRLSSVFVTFRGSGEFSKFMYPAADAQSGFDTKPWDYTTQVIQDSPFQFQLSIGSRRFPEQAISSTAEFVYNLRKALNIHDSRTRTMSFDRRDYTYDKFVIGVATSRVLGEPSSGISTRTGDLLRLTFNRNLNSGITSCLVHLVGVSVISVSESSVSVYD